MKNFYKLIPYGLAVVFAATAYSYTNNDQCGCEPAPKCDPCDPCKAVEPTPRCDPCDPCEPCEVCTPCPWQGYEACNLQPGYNAPGRIEICGDWDFFVNLNYILWQPREEGLEVGTYEYLAGGSAGKVINQDFNYKSGFQVGFGGHSDDDNWTLGLNYTWLRGSQKKSTSGSHFHPALALWHDTVSATTQKWQPRFDILDMDWGRSYYVGKALIFKTFFGGRAYWIGQKLHQSFQYPADSLYTSARGKSTSWAIGTRAGLQTKWILDEGFSVFGNAAASLAYQKIKTRYVQTYGSTTDSWYRDRLGQITPNGELELGLEWGTYIDENRWHLDFAASYIFQVWANQNSIRPLKARASDIHAGDQPHAYQKGDLMLHGLTLSTKLDF